MRNLISVFILIVLALFLAGCVEEGVKVVQVSPDGTQEDVEATTVDTTADENETTEEEPEPQTTATSTNADLEVTSFFLSALNIEQNEAFEVKFKIKNSGTDAISNFEYSIKIVKGTNVIKSKFFNYTQTLGVGETSSKIEQSYSLSSTGTYDVTVTLDPMDAFEESVETNNEKSQKVNVIAGNITTAPVFDDSNDTGGDTEYSGGCLDTDGGKVYEVKGTCQDDVSYLAPLPDFCIEATKIIELYCESGRCQQKEHTCVCEEGVCVS